MNKAKEPIDYILQYYEIKDVMQESSKKILQAYEANNLKDAWKEQMIFNESVMGLLSAFEQIIASKEVKREK